jgi:hypothetical protein
MVVETVPDPTCPAGRTFDGAALSTSEDAGSEPVGIEATDDSAPLVKEERDDSELADGEEGSELVGGKEVATPRLTGASLPDSTTPAGAGALETSATGADSGAGVEDWTSSTVPAVVSSIGAKLEGAGMAVASLVSAAAVGAAIAVRSATIAKAAVKAAEQPSLRY